MAMKTIIIPMVKYIAVLLNLALSVFFLLAIADPMVIRKIDVSINAICSTAKNIGSPFMLSSEVLKCFTIGLLK